MIDPADAESVIHRVSTTLADRFRWLDKDEIANDARLLCHDRGFVAKATTTGALHHFLSVDLVRKYAAEEERAPVSLADVDDAGTVYAYGDAGELVAFGHVSGLDHGRHTRQGAGRMTSSTAWRGTDDPEAVEGREWAASTGLAEDKRPRHAIGGRSRLLDRFRTTNRGDFLAWAGETLTDDSRWSAKAKTGHLEIFLAGSSREKADLWRRYVNGKRIGGTTSAEDREARLEDWQARYRWDGDNNAWLRGADVARWDALPIDTLGVLPTEGRHPLAMSADGQTVEVANTLREPIR